MNAGQLHPDVTRLQADLAEMCDLRPAVGELFMALVERLVADVRAGRDSTLLLVEFAERAGGAELADGEAQEVMAWLRST